ncbi:hypothetical protein TEA_001865 [Camellia sinensis var. sinensis]|uniref:Sas10 C-terminal domain-containing protein n=1 Tax=Camellia sinensis var. sinensis TaxID=542762 RepID=A0A4S4DWS9_CAMSN|nr:hypothetical protein TEA_001865 [Camellia sinensis var. sinensis]
MVTEAVVVEDRRICSDLFCSDLDDDDEGGGGGGSVDLFRSVLDADDKNLRERNLSKYSRTFRGSHGCRATSARDNRLLIVLIILNSRQWNRLGDRIDHPTEAPRLAAVLKEMKEGLDMLRSKVQALTAKVREDHFPTADGISYLEAKHLLLLNYCQSLVYYLLLKAKGLSIEGHPVVRSLVEIRLFLEKVRPIDKKLQYQIQKLTKVTAGAVDKVGSSEKKEDATQKTEDLLKYRPNPDMLVSKTNTSHEDGGGVYRPPKFAPTSMEEDKVSKQERNAMRKDKAVLREARQSAYVRELMDDLEGRPEEDGGGVYRPPKFAPTSMEEDTVSKQERNAMRKDKAVLREARQSAYVRELMDDLEGRPEEVSCGLPLIVLLILDDCKIVMLLGLTDSFYDEIKSLPLEDNVGEEMTGFGNNNSGERRPMKRKSLSVRQTALELKGVAASLIHLFLDKC